MIFPFERVVNGTNALQRIETGGPDLPHTGRHTRTYLEAEVTRAAHVATAATASDTLHKGRVVVNVEGVVAAAVSVVTVDDDGVTAGPEVVDEADAQNDRVVVVQFRRNALGIEVLSGSSVSLVPEGLRQLHEFNHRTQFDIVGGIAAGGAEVVGDVDVGVVVLLLQDILVEQDGGRGEAEATAAPIGVFALATAGVVNRGGLPRRVADLLEAHLRNLVIRAVAKAGTAVEEIILEISMELVPSRRRRFHGNGGGTRDIVDRAGRDSRGTLRYAGNATADNRRDACVAARPCDGLIRRVIRGNARGGRGIVADVDTGRSKLNRDARGVDDGIALAHLHFDVARRTAGIELRAVIVGCASGQGFGQPEIQPIAAVVVAVGGSGIVIRRLRIVEKPVGVAAGVRGFKDIRTAGLRSEGEVGAASSRGNGGCRCGEVVLFHGGGVQGNDIVGSFLRHPDVDSPRRAGPVPARGKAVGSAGFQRLNEPEVQPVAAVVVVGGRSRAKSVFVEMAVGVAVAVRGFKDIRARTSRREDEVGVVSRRGNVGRTSPRAALDSRRVNRGSVRGGHSAGEAHSRRTRRRVAVSLDAVIIGGSPGQRAGDIEVSALSAVVIALERVEILIKQRHEGVKDRGIIGNVVRRFKAVLLRGGRREGEVDDLSALANPGGFGGTGLHDRRQFAPIPAHSDADITRAGAIPARRVNVGGARRERIGQAEVAPGSAVVVGGQLSTANAVIQRAYGVAGAVRRFIHVGAGHRGREGEVPNSSRDGAVSGGARDGNGSGRIAFQGHFRGVQDDGDNNVVEFQSQPNVDSANRTASEESNRVIIGGSRYQVIDKPEIPPVAAVVVAGDSRASVGFVQLADRVIRGVGRLENIRAADCRSKLEIFPFSQRGDFLVILYYGVRRGGRRENLISRIFARQSNGNLSGGGTAPESHAEVVGNSGGEHVGDTEVQTACAVVVGRENLPRGIIQVAVGVATGIRGFKNVGSRNGRNEREIRVLSGFRERDRVGQAVRRDGLHAGAPAQLTDHCPGRAGTVPLCVETVGCPLGQVIRKAEVAGVAVGAPAVVVVNQAVIAVRKGKPADGVAACVGGLKGISPAGGRRVGVDDGPTGLKVRAVRPKNLV